MRTLAVEMRDDYGAVEVRHGSMVLSLCGELDGSISIRECNSASQGIVGRWTSDNSVRIYPYAPQTGGPGLEESMEILCGNCASPWAACTVCSRRKLYNILVRCGRHECGNHLMDRAIPVLERRAAGELHCKCGGVVQPQGRGVLRDGTLHRWQLKHPVVDRPAQECLEP